MEQGVTVNEGVPNAVVLEVVPTAKSLFIKEDVPTDESPTEVVGVTTAESPTPIIQVSKDLSLYKINFP